MRQPATEGGSPLCDIKANAKVGLGIVAHGHNVYHGRMRWNTGC